MKMKNDDGPLTAMIPLFLFLCRSSLLAIWICFFVGRGVVCQLETKMWHDKDVTLCQPNLGP
jgi:hypothetical protein